MHHQQFSLEQHILHLSITVLQFKHIMAYQSFQFLNFESKMPNDLSIFFLYLLHKYLYFHLLLLLSLVQLQLGNERNSTNNSNHELCINRCLQALWKHNDIDKERLKHLFQLFSIYHQTKLSTHPIFGKGHSLLHDSYCKGILRVMLIFIQMWTLSK